jgi:hypothetical protein
VPTTPTPNGPPLTIDEQIDAIIASGMDPVELGRKVKKGRVKKVRDHFARLLTLDDDSPSVELTVHDWKDITLFLTDPVTMENNPGAVHDDVKADIRDAITDKDAPRLLHNLLLLYKAVQG